ncbi:MAG: hypothetical protein GX284_08335, partial [Clostridiales bacterium]|nr:hypothetical protein [Clostridiales bacterium]
GVDVTINAPYAGKGVYTYYIFHCKADGTWEYIPTTEGDGTLSGRFTSFSPIFIMRVPKANTLAPSGNSETPSGNAGAIKSMTAQNATVSSTNNLSTTAPKTGENVGIYVAEMLAAISGVGAIVYVRKMRKVR